MSPDTAVEPEVPKLEAVQTKWREGWKLLIDEVPLQDENGDRIFPSYKDTVIYGKETHGIKPISTKAKKPASKKAPSKKKKKENGEPSKRNPPSIPFLDLICGEHTLEPIEESETNEGRGTKGVYSLDGGTAFVVIRHKASKSGRVTTTIRQYGPENQGGAMKKI